MGPSLQGLSLEVKILLMGSYCSIYAHEGPAWLLLPEMGPPLQCSSLEVKILLMGSYCSIYADEAPAWLLLPETGPPLQGSPLHSHPARLLHCPLGHPGRIITSKRKTGMYFRAKIFGNLKNVTQINRKRENWRRGFLLGWSRKWFF